MKRDFLFYHSTGEYHLVDGPFITSDVEGLIPGEVTLNSCGEYQVYIRLEYADWKEDEDVIRTAFGSGVYLVRKYIESQTWRNDFGQL